MMKTIIFDLNGVFIRSPKLSDRFQEAFGVPQDEFLLALKDIMPKVRMPEAGDAFAYWRPYVEAWGLKLSREEFFQFWFSGEKEDREMVDFARELRKRGCKIFILSNNFKERTEYYHARFSFLKDTPDAVYYSWQTGLTKTNPDAYRKLLADNGLTSSDCLFFDDSEENIQVAKSVGINSFRFEGIEAVQRVLRDQGVKHN
jgi:putative hydrolase of the HAD superfamily